MIPVKHHHVLIDGVPICRLPETDSWARFFTCYYQWEPSARQAAMQIMNLPANKGRRVEVVAGKCPCGR